MELVCHRWRATPTPTIMDSFGWVSLDAKWEKPCVRAAESESVVSQTITSSSRICLYDIFVLQKKCLMIWGRHSLLVHFSRLLWTFPFPYVFFRHSLTGFSIEFWRKSWSNKHTARARARTTNSMCTWKTIACLWWLFHLLAQEWLCQMTQVNH